jgi:acyl carrier protein
MGLATVELILAIEEAFQVEIPDAGMEWIKTPRHIVDFILSRHPALERPDVERLLLAVIARQLDLSPERVTLDAPLADLTGD